MNNPQPTPSPMEDSRELRERIKSDIQTRINENEQWVKRYKRAVEKLELFGVSITLKAAKLVLNEHEDRLADLKTALQQLESEE